MSRSRPCKVSVSVSSRGKKSDVSVSSRSRGIAGRSWSRSRLGPKTECLGLVSVSLAKVSFTSLGSDDDEDASWHVVVMMMGMVVGVW